MFQAQQVPHKPCQANERGRGWEDMVTGRIVNWPQVSCVLLCPTSSPPPDCDRTREYDRIPLP